MRNHENNHIDSTSFARIEEIREAVAARKLRRRWRRVAGALAAAVVFCTTYALVLPAITMTEDSIPDGVSYSSAESYSDTVDSADSADTAEDTPDEAPADDTADLADADAGEDAPDAAPDEEDTPDTAPADVFGDDDDDDPIPAADAEDTPDAAPEDEEEETSGGMGEGQSDELAEFVTRAALIDAKEKSVFDSETDTSLTIEQGRSYALTLSFAENEELQMVYGEDGTLVYYLPDCFTAEPTEEPVDIYYAADEDAEPVAVGTYEIDRFGMITVRFADCDREGEESNRNYIALYSDTAIELAITVTAAGEPREEILNFGGELKAELTVIEKQEPLLVKLLPGLFGTVELEDTAYLACENGNVTAYLTYTEEAGIPEDAILTLNDLTADLDYAAECEKAAGELLEGAALQALTSLTLTDSEGNEIVPQADVTLAFRYEGITAEEGFSYAPVVFTEDGAVAEITAVTEEEEDEDEGGFNPIASLFSLFAPDAGAVEASVLYGASVAEDGSGVAFSCITRDPGTRIGLFSYGAAVELAALIDRNYNVGNYSDINGAQGTEHEWLTSDADIVSVKPDPKETGDTRKCRVTGVYAGSAVITHNYINNKGEAASESFTVTVNTPVVLDIRADVTYGQTPYINLSLGQNGSRDIVRKTFNVKYSEFENGTAVITLPDETYVPVSGTGSPFTIGDGTASVTQNPTVGNYDSLKFRLAGWVMLTFDRDGNSDWEYKSVQDGTDFEIEQDKRTVFYPEWLPLTYDLIDADPDYASKLGGVMPTEALEFVHTYLFDYTELRNIPLSTPTFRGAGTQEQWLWTRGVSPEELLVKDTAGRGDVPTLYSPVNKADTSIAEYGLNTRGSSSGCVQGILDDDPSPKNPILKHMFDGSTFGVYDLGEADGLYYYNESLGCYEFSSYAHAATFNQRTHTMTLFNNPQNGTNDDDLGSFLPLNGNDPRYSCNRRTYSQTNLAFGMKSEIQFYLPADTGLGGNKVDGKDMVFEFEGDDDVWVFVDDTLILDIGGTHAKVKGKINFSTGAWSIDSCYNRKTGVYGHVDGGAGTAKGTYAGETAIPAGEHKLSIYYMERGGGGSNCLIRFKLLPRWEIEDLQANTITANKEWNDGTAANKNHDPITLALYEVAADGTVGETFVPGTEQQLGDFNNWSYTWEALDTDKEYTVREIDTLPNYDVRYGRRTSGSWDYWYSCDAESFPKLAKEGVYVTVAYTEENGDTYALTGDLGVKKIEKRSGVLLSESIDSSVKWQLSAAEGGKWYLSNAEGEYLSVAGGKLAVTEEADCAFQMSSAAGTRFTNNNYHPAYSNGRFIAAVNQGDADGSEADVYALQSVPSKVYTFTVTNTWLPTFRVQKVSSADTTETLEGAVFTLSRPSLILQNTGTDENAEQIWAEESGYLEFRTADGSWIRTADTAPDANGMITGTDGERYDVTLTTDVNGELLIGLVLDTVENPYLLTELSAPEGFAVLRAPVSITVKDGAITAVSTGDDYDNAYLSNTDNLTLVVEDHTYVCLPQTGGMGTFAYTAAGILLMELAAAAVVVMKKREI